MKLVQRVSLSFGLVIILVLIMVAISVVGVSQMNHSLANVADKAAPVRLISSNIHIYALQHRRFEKDFFLNSGNVETQKEYLGKYAKVSEKMVNELGKMETLLPLLDSGTQVKIRPIFTTIKEQYQAYKAGFDGVSQEVLAQPSMTPGEGNQKMIPFKTPIHQLETNVDSLVALSNVMFDENVQHSVAQGSIVQDVTVAVSVIALLIALVAAMDYATSFL